eukprot:1594759-Alexandrium_andersonii.AAC.1
MRKMRLEGISPQELEDARSQIYLEEYIRYQDEKRNGKLRQRDKIKKGPQEEEQRGKGSRGDTGESVV